jgi:hypothetical protein
VTIKREDLIGQFDLEADISTAEVDNQKAQDMAFMLQTIGNTMDSGITIMILSEIAMLKRMPELAEKLRTYKPQVSPEQQQMQALQLEEMKLKVEELKSKIALNNAKAAEAGANKIRRIWITWNRSRERLMHVTWNSSVVRLRVIRLSKSPRLLFAPRKLRMVVRPIQTLMQQLVGVKSPTN